MRDDFAATNIFCMGWLLGWVFLLVCYFIWLFVHNHIMYVP